MLKKYSLRFILPSAILLALLEGRVLGQKVPCQTDIALVIDHSGSIRDANRDGVDNWSTLVEFLKMVIDNLDVGFDRTRVGMVTFANRAEVIFRLNQFNTWQEMNRAVDNIFYEGGNTNTTGGLRVARTQLFTPLGGDRPGVQDVLFLVTDGVPTREVNGLLPEVARLKIQGIRVIAIGVTDRIDDSLLRAIASEPKDDHSHHVNNFDSLKAIIEQIIEEGATCVETTPAPAPTPRPIPVPGPPGATGEPGPTGPPGSRGPPGTAGNPGAPGLDGRPGVAGQQGPLGPPGDPGPNGPTGPTGATGQRGPQGPTGLAGLSGPVGLTGSAGPPGQQGLPGPSGPSGSPGASGSTGPSGPPGSPGSRGNSGRAGATGRPGPPGTRGLPGEDGRDGRPGVRGAPAADGVTGSTGATGSRGFPGLDGVTGSTGPAGPPGPVGLTGFPGLPGQDGRQGPPGQSGSEGGVGGTGSTGHTGPAGWQGATGPPGPRGSIGSSGVQGLPGSPGLQGTNGATGIPGRPGSAGPPGRVGATGGTGRPGPVGRPGANGQRGFPGSPGFPGSRGASGSTGRGGQPGRDGRPGSTGPTGRTGATGAQGQRGAVGATGPTGLQGRAGATGSPGIPGQSGRDGRPGQRGAPGPQGDPGERGPDGQAGFPGTNGATGSTGRQGPRGFPGEAGPPGAGINTVNECGINNGGCSQLCVDTYDSWYCMCRSGYAIINRGFACNPSLVTCSQVIGAGLLCWCTDAATPRPLNGTGCGNINECEARNGGCEQTCVDLGGDFYCACAEGYLLARDGLGCDDQNECLSNEKLCLRPEYCLNTYGSYYCITPEGEDGRYLGLTGRDDSESVTSTNSLAVAATVAGVVSVVILVLGLLAHRLVGRIKARRRAGSDTSSPGLGGHTPRFLDAGSWGFNSVRSKLSASGESVVSKSLSETESDLSLDAVGVNVFTLPNPAIPSGNQ